jgi:acetate kinase
MALAPTPCIVTINAGSSSLKLGVFHAGSLARLATVHVAQLGDAATITSWIDGDHQTAPLDGVAHHDAALSAAVTWLDHRLGGTQWCAVGHRVTHGRHRRGPEVVDAALVAELQALVPLAPLHQPHNLAGIAAATRHAPSALQVACFDTAFHRSTPDVARRYALPQALRADIEAYGFHGLSYEYIASILPAQLGARAEGRVIVAHLGSGASLCAMRGRRSIATTMGFTPLDGLVMATRSGALDPGVLLYLLEARKLTAEQLRDLLYLQSGLLGVSGISDSMKVLLASGQRSAAEAVELFVYRAAGAIGSLAAALGGLDALVFTGGIGEHSPEIRARISDATRWLGAELDDRAHAAGRAVFSTPASAVALCVVPTDEEVVIARHVAALFSASTRRPTP